MFVRPEAELAEKFRWGRRGRGPPAGRGRGPPAGRDGAGTAGGFRRLAGAAAPPCGMGGSATARTCSTHLALPVLYPPLQ